jgi:hypothetical protein
MDGHVQTNNALQMYFKFCDDIGIDSQSNYDKNIKTLLILFQKNIDIKSCYVQTFPDNPFLDWSMLDQIKLLKIFKDSLSWLTLLKFLRFEEKDIQWWKSFNTKQKLYSHFTTCLFNANLNIETKFCIQLFILLHIVNLQATNVIELFFSELFDRCVKKEAMLFLSLFADIVFDRQDRTEVLTTLLKTIISVDVNAFGAELDLLKNRESKLVQIFKQKSIQASCLRPKLRSKLKTDSMNQSALASLDTFQSWCDAIRFPNVFSQHYKKKIYFTMSQKHICCNTFLPQYFTEPELCQIVLQYQVNQPDASIITDVILQCRLISEPFSEIHKFRERCFNSFSMQQKSKLRLNDLLHLYIASYQPELVWKEVWKNIIAIISIQIIKDVEDFITEFPINSSAIMGIVFHNAQKQLL